MQVQDAAQSMEKRYANMQRKKQSASNIMSSLPQAIAFSELVHNKQYNMLKSWRERKREKEIGLTGLGLENKKGYKTKLQ